MPSRLQFFPSPGAKLGLAGLILFLSGLFYLLTLSPSLSFIDSGELAAACTTLGIAHSPGYPLYILLGRIFSLLPFGESIFRFNLMSLLFAGLANLILFFSLILISDIFDLKELTPRLKISTAVLVTLLFSFSPILWSQAITNEVYSLNILLCSLILLLAFSWFKKSSTSPSHNDSIRGIVFLLAYLTGLSSGNHFLSLLLLPPLLFLFISTEKRGSYGFRSLMLFAIFFILGISIYLYQPIRASLNPAINWGNPSSWQNLLNHLTVKMHQIRMFSQPKIEFWNNLDYFASSFIGQFPLWSFPLMLLGLFKSFKQNLKLTIFFLLIVFFNLLWSLNYAIKDIDPYFLQTILTASFLLYLGLLFFFEILGKLVTILKASAKTRSIINYAVLLLLILSFLPNLSREFKTRNRSRNYIPYDFTSNILRSSHMDALVLTEVWDYYSPWLYLRFVENKRPDLEIVHTQLLEWSWYKSYLKKYYPRTYKESSSEIDNYTQFSVRLEKGHTVDSLEASLALSKMIDSFIFKNLSSRPVYTTLLDAYKGYAGLPTTTEGLLIRFREGRKLYPYEFPEFQLRGIQNPDILKTKKELVCIAHYAVAYYNRGLYLKFFNLNEEAEGYFQKAYYFKDAFLRQAPDFKFGYF